MLNLLKKLLRDNKQMQSNSTLETLKQINNFISKS